MSWLATCAPTMPLVAAALFTLLLSPSFGQSAEPLLYRRIFVPEESLNQQIRGLLPLKQEEFERRAAQINGLNDSNASMVAARIEHAVFRARFEGTELASGEADLDVVASSNQSSLLSLEPCSLALESATWQTKDPSPAVIGRGPSGQLQCVIKESGTLRLEWKQEAADVSGGMSRFDLRLPNAPRRRLEITAAPDIELEIDGGLILDREVRPVNSGERVWPIELTGAAEIRLHAKKINAKQSAGGRIVVREDTHYNVLPAVIDLQTSFTLDVLREPLRELMIDIDKGVEVTAVQIDQQRLPFSVAPQRGGRQRVAIELPTEFSGIDRVVAVEATAPWTPERAIDVPRMSIVGGTLQEGRLEVYAPAWLRLQTRPLRGCIQIDAAPATAARPTDRFVFQVFAANAAVEMAPDTVLAPLREESGTQLNVEATQVTGVLVAELRATGGGARFSIAAEVPHQWMVDAVETQPADMLADRTVVSSGQNPHRLQLKLARPLTAQQPLRLVIRGHFRRPPNDQPLGDEFFHLARFPEVHDRRELVAVHVNDPAAELRLTSGEGVPRLDPATLTAADLRLFESPPGTLLLETGSLGQSLRASLRATTARYRADTEVHAEIARGRIEQTVTIHCQPETSNVAAITVRVAPRPRGEVMWRLAGDEAREISALLEESPSAGIGAGDAVYRLLLPRPYSTPFNIVGQWSNHQSASDELSLVFVPSAIRQTGLVEIAAPDCDVFVRSQELQAMPTLGQEQSSALCGRYRYEAGRRSKLSVEPLPSGVVQELTWVDSLLLTSHYLSDGAAEHEAELKIQNAGSHEFSMRIPASASECRLVTDSKSEEPLDPTGPDNMVLIPLPADQRSVTVRVRYVSKDSSLGIWPVGTVRAPVPHFDVPVLSQSWRVMLPPDLDIATQSRQPADSEVRNPEQHEGPLRAVPANPLRDRFESAARVFSGPALAMRWMTTERGRVSAGDSSFAGWNEYVLPLPASEEALLSVYRPRVLMAWSYCIALAAGALVFWLRGRSGWLLLPAGLLAAMAIVSAAPTAWLLGGASLGIVLGQLLLLSRSATRPDRSMRLNQPATTAGHYAIEPSASVVVFLALVFAARLVAAAPAENSPAGHDRPRVVIPVDSQQQPTGEYLFVEGGLYERLHQFSDAISSVLPNVLLEKALYELSAAPTARADTTAIDELRATLDFHTFRADEMVQLPLRRNQALLLEGRARLDGLPTTLSWNSDGREISLVVGQPGKHRLELALASMLQQSNDAVRLEMDVPAAAIAQVALRGNASGGTVISNGARGKLLVRWPTADARQPNATSLEADQLLWWKVRPGSVSLEGRFRLRPVGGPVRELVLEADPRLRLLPGRTGGPIAAVKVEEGAIQLIKAELVEPIATPTELRFAWLWPDASGAGTFMLPNVRLRADRLARDWIAVTAEPGLELSRIDESKSGPAAAEITPADVYQIWPELNLGDRPMIVASPDAEDQAVVVRPVAAAPHAEQRTDWSVTSALARATFTAQLTGMPPSRYEHRLDLPANLKVSRVTITQAGRAIPVRWKQESQGLLIASLLESPGTEQTMTVIADCPLPRGPASTPLPALGLESVTDDGCTLRFYRQSNVQLKIEATSGWLPVDQERLDEYRPGLGRLVTTLRRQTSMSAPPRVTRTANQPRITGRIFTRVHEDDGDWRGDVILRLAVSGGLLDELRLSIPEDWGQPLEVEPVMEQRLEASQSEARRQLVLRPRRSLTGAAEITLRAPIYAGAGGLQAPDVFPVGNSALERFVLLDRGSVIEEIDWEMTGLLSIGAGAVANLPPVWHGAGDWFRVVAQRFDAVAKARPARTAAPRVSLADIRCTPRSGRRIVVTAALTIQPRGAREAEFMLPPGSRLVQALVDDLPAPCIPQGLRSWKIPALSETLPYRLTLVYDASAPPPADGAARSRLAAPALLGMEVQESLWTIETDRLEPNSENGYQLRFEFIDRTRACTLAATELARLQALSHLLDSVASTQTVELPRRILADSFLRWKRELTEIEHRLQALQAQKQLTSDMATEMQSALDLAARSEQRLLQAGVLSESEVGETMQARHSAPLASATYCLTTGSPGELGISWKAAEPASTVPRGAIAAAVALGAILIASLFQLAVARDFFSKRPHWAVALLGVAWWLLAPLGWIGWLAILIAACCEGRLLWTRGSYEPGSSIVRWSGSESR
jgi:hypothetical protein